MNKNSKNKGITLIALVITIIVLLLLAGVTIASVTGDNGILSKSEEARFKTIMADYSEQLELYKQSKEMESANFLEDTLNASENSLEYNTKNNTSENSIRDIINNIENKYIDKIEVIKGKLVYNTQESREIGWAKGLNIDVNPYDIENGELMSSKGNLLLMDSTGTLTIPANVTKIGYGAFSGLDGLKKIIIPPSVKEIGAYAFCNNKTLETVIIQGDLTTIGEYAFDGASKLKEINLPDSINSIGFRTFRSTNISEIVVPKNLKILEYETFRSCKKLEKIMLQDGITEIKQAALSGCQINEIKIPSTLKKIGEGAFEECKKLSKIDLSNNSDFVYESGMLMNSKRERIIFISDAVISQMTTFDIPEGVTVFSTNIRSYTKLTKIILPTTLTAIETSCFPTTINNIEVKQGNQNFISKDGLLYTKDNILKCCYSKEKIINIPEGILEVGQWSFFQATETETVNLPESLKKIDEVAFPESNLKLKQINIGKNVNDIAARFKNSIYDVKINVDEKNLYYMVKNNVLYKKGDSDKYTLVTVLSKIENTIKIDNDVKIIGEKAFYGQTEMLSIEIPDGVTEIKEKAFTNCPKLKEIKIPQSVTSIGDNCFADATNNLESIIINRKKDSIPNAPWGAVKGLKVVEWNG